MRRRNLLGALVAGAASPLGTVIASPLPALSSVRSVVAPSISWVELLRRHISRAEHDYNYYTIYATMTMDEIYAELARKAEGLAKDLGRRVPTSRRVK